MRSSFRQIRPIVDGDSPARCAIDVRDQCVASVGVASSVDGDDLFDLVATGWTAAVPGRGSSTRPLQPPVHEPAPPLRHRLLPDPSLGCHVGVTKDPSAHARTIFDRNAVAWVELDRRAQR